MPCIMNSLLLSISVPILLHVWSEGNGMEDPKIFDLKELDTDQWCKSLKDAGMKMVYPDSKTP